MAYEDNHHDFPPQQTVPSPGTMRTSRSIGDG
ncbi:uncharacterized protein METZ01_LOCUS254894 [marine metagenome]|uniref:Uncharacterized protein n=1 Tax=marine metagenome TaxID=408172 RepID=A0A382IQS9_9ZZZZ